MVWQCIKQLTSVLLISALLLQSTVYAAGANNETGTVRVVPGPNVMEAVYAPPVLNGLPPLTNEETIQVEGTSAAHALITVYTSYEGRPLLKAGNTQAGEEGHFSAQIPLGAEGNYAVTATAEIGGEVTVPSASVTIRVDRTAPERPVELQWTTPSPDTIRLQWVAPWNGESPSHYVVLRDGETVGQTSGLFFDESGLTRQKAYRYEVLSADEAGNVSEGGFPIVTGTPGKNERKLLQAGAGEAGDAAISEDGSRIAYVQVKMEQDDTGNPRYRSKLFVENLVSGEMMTFSPPEGVGRIDYPKFSRDGAKLLYSLVNSTVYDLNNEVYVVDLGSGNQQRITTEEQLSALAFISGDGHRVWFQAGKHEASSLKESFTIFEYELVSGHRTSFQLPYSEENEEVSVDYVLPSSDGRMFVYGVLNANNGGLAAYLYDRTNSKASLLGENVFATSFSRDNKRLSFTKEGSVYTVDTSSLEETVIFAQQELQTYHGIRISADGHRFLIESDENKDHDEEGLFIYEPTTRAKTKIGNPAVDRSAVALSGDGSKVIYSSIDRSGLPLVRSNYLFCMQACDEVNMPGGDPIYSVSWQASELLGGQAVLGSDLALTVRGEPGSAVKADIEYLMNVEAAEETPLSKHAEIDMQEDRHEAGTFKANFPLVEGIREIRAIQIYAEDPKGNKETAEAELLPLQVTGALKLLIDSEQPNGHQQSKILAWNKEGKFVNQVIVNGDTVMLPLPEGEAFRLSWRASTGVILAVMDHAAVRSGAYTELTLHEQAPASVTVTVRNAYGESLGDIPVTLSRPESGELVSHGRTSAAGILTLPAGYEGETIRVEAKLGRPYLASEPYLLKLSRQTETVIEAKVPTGIVYGVVKNGDQPVTNVRVTVSQPQMT
ncbi:hypothetical protein SAMN04488602_1441, partial [Paenibacillus sp. cl123]